MKTAIFAALLLLSGNALAQVANGSFEQGNTGWGWKSAAPAMGTATCVDAAYANSGTNLWWMQSPPASGYVAKLVSQYPYAAGTWWSCRQVEQSVYVPNGAQLSFVARIGDDVSAYDYYPYNPGTLTVLVRTSTGENQIFSVEGQSAKCSSPSGCARFQPYTVGMSRYWGQTVTLVIRGASYASNSANSMTSQPSALYVDNVAIQ